MTTGSLNLINLKQHPWWEEFTSNLQSLISEELMLKVLNGTELTAEDKARARIYHRMNDILDSMIAAKSQKKKTTDVYS